MGAPNINDCASGVPQQFYDAELPAYSFLLTVATLSGTATIVNGLSTVVFSAAQTLIAGSTVYFSSQPGVPYTVAASVTASTSVTLTSNYTGTASTAATTNSVAALSGTVTVTNGSASITFSTAQTITAGTLLFFSSQPGVPYTLAAAVSASTAGTLSSIYLGTTSSTATTIACAALSATVAVTNGSSAITFSVAQTLPAEASLMFASQPGVIYTLATAVAASTTGTLTTAYSGTSAGATTCVSGTNDYVPTKANYGNQGQSGVARGLLCTSGGVAVVDLYGLNGQGSGSTWVSIPLTVGQQLQCAFTKLRHTSQGAFVSLF